MLNLHNVFETVILENNKTLLNIIKNIQPRLIGNDILVIEGSFVKEIFNYFNNSALNKIGDIDMHIVSESPDNKLLAELLPKLLGLPSSYSASKVVELRNAFKLIIPVVSSGIIKFKNIITAELEIMVIPKLVPRYRVLGVPKITFYSNGEYLIENFYPYEQYLDIVTPYDISIPFNTIDPNRELHIALPSGEMIWLATEITQYTKAYLLIFYNKSVKEHYAPLAQHIGFYSAYILQDMTSRHQRHELLRGIYDSLYSYWDNKKQVGLIERFILLIFINSCYTLSNSYNFNGDYPHINSPKPNSPPYYIRAHHFFKKIVRYLKQNNINRSIHYSAKLYDLIFQHLMHDNLISHSISNHSGLRA